MADDETADFLARLAAQEQQVDAAIVGLAQRLATYNQALFAAGFPEDMRLGLVEEFHSALLAHMMTPDVEGD